MTPLSVIVILIVCGVVGGLIGQRKGYAFCGALAGLIVGPLGLLAVALWHPSHKELVRRERERIAAETEARTCN